MINAVIDDEGVDYYEATNEGDAVAMVCGAYTAGRKGVVMFQNSRLGNAVNALTSLSFPFRFPFITIVTHRGQPGDPADEPQNELMGAVTEGLLTTMRMKWCHFPENRGDLEEAFTEAIQYMDEHQLPFVFVMRKGTIKSQDLKLAQNEHPIGNRQFKFSESIQKPYSDRPTRTDALKLLHKYRLSSDIYIATTGKTGRELYVIDNNPKNFYKVGSMGSATSYALGASHL